MYTESNPTKKLKNDEPVDYAPRMEKRLRDSRRASRSYRTLTALGRLSSVSDDKTDRRQSRTESIRDMDKFRQQFLKESGSQIQKPPLPEKPTKMGGSAIEAKQRFRLDFKKVKEGKDQDRASAEWDVEELKKQKVVVSPRIRKAQSQLHSTTTVTTRSVKEKLDQELSSPRGGNGEREPISPRIRALGEKVSQPTTSPRKTDSPKLQRLKLSGNTGSRTSFFEGEIAKQASPQGGTTPRDGNQKASPRNKIEEKKRTLRSPGRKGGSD